MSTNPTSTHIDQEESFAGKGSTVREESPEPPSNYTILRCVSNSLIHYVYMCLPNSALEEARSALTMGTDEESVTEALLKRVVVWKENRTSSTNMTSEIRVLLEIRRQTSLHSGGEHCVQILDYDDKETRVRKKEQEWLVMAASPVCCDLQTLYRFDRMAAFPKALLWLIITELSDAFWFLQRVCDPPIAHREISKNGVLITFPHEANENSESTTAKRPKITLTGFGHSSMRKHTASKDKPWRKAAEDAGMLALEIYYHVKKHYGDIPRRRGKAMMLGPSTLDLDAPKEVENFLQVHGEVKSLEQLQKEIGNFAKEKLEEVGDEEWDELRNLVAEAAESKGSWKAIIKDVLSGQPKDWNAI